MDYIWVCYKDIKMKIGVSAYSMHKFRSMAQVFSYYNIFLFNNNAASWKSETFTHCCHEHCCLKTAFLTP